MASTPYSPSALSGADFPGCAPQAPCDPLPVCPACGGLQTLCRPRFFAGQMLTEDDLNRLDRYMLEKSRLHNRYLHGWGVVCGLEVVCSVCNAEGDRGKVVVKPGYALSPCGNDIVVPKPGTVDVCALIERCRPPTDPCAHPYPGNDADCVDAQEDWVLAICYHEQNAREVAALRADPCCEGKHPAGACGCCGGSQGSCGCGAQPAARPAARPAAASVTRAPQCEPTVVCETWCLKAYKLPPATNKRQPDMAPMVKRFVCCLLPFMEDLGGLPAGASTPVQLQQWLLNLKEALRQFLLREGLYDCEVAQAIAAVEIPPVTSTDYLAPWTAATVAVLAIALLVLQKCLCAALLPPCPEPALDDCVPIATVTVARKPCRVIKICNFSSRRFLLTWPNVQYWLGWTPVFGPATGANPPRTLRDLLVRMCCTRLGEQFRVRAEGSIGAHFQTTSPVGAVAPGTGDTPTPVAAAGESRTVFARLLASALAEHPEGADLGTLLLAAMGAPDAQGKPLASPLELANPGEFELMNELLVPMLRMTLPATERGTAAGEGADLQALREELAAMKGQLAQHEDTINELKRRKG